jgi:phospholipid/cholesterol/gamma-HCH transport system substrate-binding protein
MGRFRRNQLIAFAILAVVALVVGAVSYVRLPQLLGFGQYDVDVSLGTASGLYPKARVTYRGVDIGQVRDITLDPRGGVTAVVRLDGAMPVPTDAIASVDSTSGVGEQYLQLTPQRDSGPYLSDGALIPRTQTREPVSTNELLGNVRALLASVPSGDLKNLLDQSYLATRGVGDDFGQLLQSSQLLVGTLRQHLPAARTLVQDLQPVLTTQQRNDDNIRAFTRDAASFTDQLRLSDGTIRDLLDRAPSTLNDTTGLVNDLRPTVPLLLANLSSVGQIVRVYLPGVEQVLVVYPQFTTFLQSILTQNPGLVRLQARLQTDPPPCIKGYDSNIRGPDAVDTPPTKPNSYCQEGPNYQSAVRGARNLPCPVGDGRGPTPESCGVDTRPYGMTGGPYTGPGAPYDSSTGIFAAPDGKFYRLASTSSDDRQRSATPAASKQAGWESLLSGGQS